jgi:hypothetical protein
MCHGARIFIELAPAQSSDILDALDRFRAHIS